MGQYFSFADYCKDEDPDMDPHYIEMRVNLEQDKAHRDFVSDGIIGTIGTKVIDSYYIVHVFVPGRETKGYPGEHQRGESTIGERESAGKPGTDNKT